MPLGRSGRSGRSRISVTRRPTSCVIVTKSMASRSGIARRAWGVDEVLTAPHDRWQKPVAERLIGSIRRACLNHVLILGERHLHRILTRYFAYHHQARTYLALDKDAPDLRPIEPPAAGKIVQLPEVGGLHHRYRAKPRSAAPSVLCITEGRCQGHLL